MIKNAKRSMRPWKWFVAAGVTGALAAGLACDTGIGGGAGLPAGLDTPPKVVITAPATNVLLENGESTGIQYFAQSAEQAATLDLYLDIDSLRGNGNEVPIQTGIVVPAGASGVTTVVTFNSTNAPNGTYRVFGVISDGVNAPFTAVSAGSITVAPIGTRPRPQAPFIAVLEPLPNLALSGLDTVTIVYAYQSVESAVTVTLLLDKDRNPNNDDINNPGNPQNANTNIIILPSAPRRATDPTFGNDPPPPDDPNNPPTNPDSVQIRTNPRVLSPTAEGLGFVAKTYRFEIDLSKIPPRPDGQPYNIRATISDGINPPASAYAVGSLNITSAAAGTVDLGKVGTVVSGARIQGFSQGEWLGWRIVPVGDLDSDLNDDFMLIARYGSARNRTFSGTGYLVFGRHKVPYPPDTDGNGLPDSRDEFGNVVNFPQPPTFIYDPLAFGNVSPYDPRAVGRFGGLINVNSIGAVAVAPLPSAFYRGALYTMPLPHPTFNFCEYVDPANPFSGFKVYTPPPPGLSLRDELDEDGDGNVSEWPAPFTSGLFTSGLYAMGRVDLTGDGVRDFVFGLPFISNPREWHDDDPCDHANEDTEPISQICYGDGMPNPCSTSVPDFAVDTLDVMSVNNAGRGNREESHLPITPGHPTCTQPSDAPIAPVDTPLMIVVSGANDIANQFRQFVDAGMAGMITNSATPPRQVFDEEGILRPAGSTPIGMRFRGAWRSFGGGGTNQWYAALDSYNEWASDIAGIPSIDNDFTEELLVSAPGAFGERGLIELFNGQDFVNNGGFYGDTVRSLPSFECFGSGDNQRRRLRPTPTSIGISGAAFGDRLGGARGARQVDQDSKPDLMFGAPGADRRAIDPVTRLPAGPTLTDNGIFYILFQPPGGFGPAFIPFDPDPINDPPSVQLARFEIRGTHNGDRFGEVQESVGDINGDTIADAAFASPYFPAQPDPLINRPVGAGFVGVVFGKRQITGEIGFRPEECGTSRLPGVRFYGVGPGTGAGSSIAGAGDFDGDGIDDLLINCPGEVRAAPDGTFRTGVVYLIFGGPHLENQEFTLSQVGTSALPGVVFLSPYSPSGCAQGALDCDPNVRIQTVAGIGDIDGDGFDDVAIGMPKADFVFPNSPFQRRRDAGEVVIIYGNNLAR